MIVSYGSADDVAACLASVARYAPSATVAIREHGGDEAFERLVAVADASTTTTRVDHDPSNPGFGAGCNALAAQSTATWFLFLNPDARLQSWPWDDASPDSPAVLGPVFTAHDGDHRGRSYRIRDEIRRSWLRRPGLPPDGHGFVSGAAMMIDAATFRAVRGFDTDYFLFYEDIDLCLRANAAGTPTRIEPRWSVSHSRGHSTSDHFGTALSWSYESGCRFHAAHGSPVAWYRLYVAADAAMRALAHGLRRDASRRRDYVQVCRRAISDCVRRVPSRP